MLHRITVLAASLLLLAAAPAQDGGDAILGLWATQPDDHGYAHIEIEREAATYRGTIVWLSRPNYPPDDPQGMGGAPKVDRENPDATLRRRPIIGLRILDGFAYVGDGVWKRGTIYDPANGKTYKCTMRLQADGTLKVRGFIGFSLLGRTTVWTRPPADAP